MDQCLFLAKDKANWTMEVVEFLDKMTWWAKFSKNLSKRKTQLTLWMKEGLQNLFCQIIKLRCLMDSKHDKCTTFVKSKESKWLLLRPLGELLGFERNKIME
jgi:hypothetical protein